MSALTPSTGPQPQPEQYRTGKGCLLLILITVAALGALAVFVALFGNVST